MEHSMKLSDSLRRTVPAPFRRALKRQWTQRYGTFRDQERLGLLDRPSYAYGLLRAADIARYFGHEATTVCEFGVAFGAGLFNMIDLAEKVTAETGIRFRIVGFDTGKGLPAPSSYKDHPEVWSGGDYEMSPEKVLETIDGRAELLLGDIKETVGPFLESLDPAAPLGFISVDVDIYTSAKNSLTCLLGRPDLYLPAVSVYFDDVGHFFANRWCGEFAAIEEFNAENSLRKLDHDWSRRHLDASWWHGMYVCHLLDHPARNAPDPTRPQKMQVGENLPPGVLH
jgi:hypothetical protein